MKNKITCPHCGHTLPLRPLSFLFQRIECPHCHSRYRLSLTWPVCILIAILAVSLAGLHFFIGLIIYLLVIFILIYFFLPFWINNNLIRIQMRKRQD